MPKKPAPPVSEWFKVQSWKDCVGDEPTGSSNLPRSARFDDRPPSVIPSRAPAYGRSSPSLLGWSLSVNVP
jgi:hypothetical protein